MPFTPLHMLPAWCAKELVPTKKWSLEAFCLTQVGIDVEPLYHLLLNGDVFHGFLHTWTGAAVAASVVVAILRQRKRREPVGPLVIGAMAGAISHVLLDSIMHADVTALGAQWLFGLIDLDTLHRVLFASGAVAAIAACLRSRRMQTTHVFR